MSTGMIWSTDTVFIRWFQQFRLFVPIIQRHTWPWPHWVHVFASPRRIGQIGCSKELRRRSNSWIRFCNSFTISSLLWASFLVSAKIGRFSKKFNGWKNYLLVPRMCSFGSIALFIIFSLNNLINSHALIGQFDVFDNSLFINAFCWTPPFKSYNK